MQKIKAKIYAQALYELCEREKDTDKVIRNFVNVLASHNRLSLINEIIKYFQVYFDKNQSLIDVKVETARELDEDSRKEVIKLVKDMQNAKQIELEVKIKPALLGGLVLNFQDWQIDGSLKKKLLIIKENINK